MDRGYEVHGLIRRSSSFNTGRIQHLYKDPLTHREGCKFIIVLMDIVSISHIDIYHHSHQWLD